jgi:hypothetical protein
MNHMSPNANVHVVYVRRSLIAGYLGLQPSLPVATALIRRVVLISTIAENAF